jgi:cupin domain
MDLPPGKGIPLHSHPYAKIFYVVTGYTDFLRVDEQGQEEWVRCGPGDTLVAPMNALHGFHNRTTAECEKAVKHPPREPPTLPATLSTPAESYVLKFDNPQNGGRWKPNYFTKLLIPADLRNKMFVSR